MGNTVHHAPIGRRWLQFCFNKFFFFFFFFLSKKKKKNISIPNFLDKLFYKKKKEKRKRKRTLLTIFITFIIMDN
jgi:hypothetical protein